MNRYVPWAMGAGLFLLAGGGLAMTPWGGRLPSHFWNGLWCLWIVAVVFFLPQPHLPARLRHRSLFGGIALACATLLLAVRFFLGLLLDGLAASPYDLSPNGMMLNLWNIFPFLIACEVLRAYAFGTFCRGRRRGAWVAAITLLLGIVQINLPKLALLRDAESWFIFAAKDVLPVLAQSCLLSALVYCGGAASGVAYAGIISGFLHLFPFLPSLPWIGESAVGIAFPAFAAMFVWEQHRAAESPRIAPNKEPVVGLATGLLAVVGFAWFVVGVFPVYPSVVLTGSMEPGIYPGDVVLVEKLATEKEIYNLAEQDIINFQREDIVITHRIIRVQADADGNVSFETKGDNNKTADRELVLPKNVNGLVKKTLPKIGAPILWLKGQGSIPEGVVEDEEA